MGSSSPISPFQIVAEPQPTVGQGDVIQEGADLNTTNEATNEAEDTTDEATNKADYSQMPTHYSQMVIIPSVQQHRLLSLLEQGLSIVVDGGFG